MTLTTTGYGDVTPLTPLGRMLAGIVMVSGILVFALWAGILATGFAEETRRREFLRTWDLVAKVPFFHDVGAAVIADVARLLRPARLSRRRHHRAPRRTRRLHVFRGLRRGRDCSCSPNRCVLGPGEFFGEVALVTGGPRNATSSRCGHARC